MELGSAVVVGAALLSVGLMWIRGWWSRVTRLVVTAPVLLLLVLPVLQEQLRDVPPVAAMGMPTEYAGVYTPIRGSAVGDGEESPQVIRTTGPGTLYVAFTCRGEGHVQVRLGLEFDVHVGQDCVPGETRELREWIKVEAPAEIPVSWASAADVRRNFVIQFIAD